MVLIASQISQSDMRELSQDEILILRMTGTPEYFGEKPVKLLHDGIPICRAYTLDECIAFAPAYECPCTPLVYKDTPPIGIYDISPRRGYSVLYPLRGILTQHPTSLRIVDT